VRRLRSPGTYHPRMVPTLAPPGALAAGSRAISRWAGGWWRTVHLGAVLMVLALSPSSYTRDTRARIARAIVLEATPILLWYTLGAVLFGLVLIRIVVVTAASYGLSQYALQMVVRVLVLELIPLTAAIFVALRIGLPDGRELARMRLRGELESMRRRGLDPLRHEVMPRVLAAALAVLLLAAVASVTTLVLAYLTVHGFALGGFERYTRIVGQVFTPTVTLVFMLKTLLLAMAVSLIPAASAIDEQSPTGGRMGAELQALVRLFLVMLLIEVMSLVGNYT